MMNNLIHATIPEALIIKQQSSGIFLRLLREQPPEGWKLIPFPNHTDGCVYFEPDSRDEAVQIKLRHPSGKKYRVKEPWGYEGIYDSLYGEMEGDFIYKADGKNNSLYGWHSPVTMPAEAVRWNDIEVDTTVKRVSGLTWFDKMKILGLIIPKDEKTLHHVNVPSHCAHQYFTDHWNSLHANPVREGDRWASYPYDKSAVESFICETCGGDGKETCDNPDHCGIDSGLFGREIHRLGCPVCGHNEDYKVPNGGDCFDCHGTGYSYKGKPLTILIPYVEVLDWRKKEE